MATAEQCILTNMVMVYDDNGNILVQDRVDPDWPGLVFPGGHVEPRESFIKSAVREVKEETGLDVYNLRLCGVKQFTISRKNLRYIVFYYKTKDFTGEIQSSDEGRIFWIRRDDLTKYNLADGFEEMLEVFENDNLNENFLYYDEKWYSEKL